jgi:hypothetical protein
MSAGEEESKEALEKAAELDRATRDAWIRKGERMSLWIIIGCGLLYGGLARGVFGMNGLAK